MSSASRASTCAADLSLPHTRNYPQLVWYAGEPPEEGGGDDSVIRRLGALLAAGANVNMRAMNGATALHRAAARGRVVAVQYLLQQPGIDPSLLDVAGCTPLMHACSRGHLEVARLLLETVSKVGDVDMRGNTALHALAASKEVDSSTSAVSLAALLVKAGINVMHRNAAGKLASDVATLPTLVAFLKGIQWQGDMPFLPLHAAVFNGDVLCVRSLLDNDFNLYTVDAAGNTAMHIAVMGNSVELVTMLATAGSPLNLLNAENRSPFTLAHSLGLETVAKQLQKLGANVTLGMLRTHFCAYHRIGLLYIVW